MIMTSADSRIAEYFQKRLHVCMQKRMASNLQLTLPLGSSVALTRGSVIVANDLTGKGSHKFNLEDLANAAVVVSSALVGRTLTNVVVVVVVNNVRLGF